MKSHVSQVLIVEDDDQGRLLLERILETEGGYEATPAASVVEARQFLLNHEYEAILIDVCLPAQSGIALLEYVHARHIDTAAIMVTGHDDRHLIEAAFANGAYGYVVKPFRVGELLISLANALHRRELEIHNRSHVRELEEKVLVRTRALHETLAPLGEEVLPPIAVEEVIERLSAALTVRHEESGAHIRRVSEFSALLADRAGLMTSDHAEFRLASSLHDVGKIGVPDAILQKPGPLTPGERAVMERHTVIGHTLLKGSASAVLSLGATIALTHHERWDGTGYPMGLAAEAIPIVGRVVAIADVFDALTNDRVYRAASSVEEAVATMAHGRAKDFDPALLDAFLGSMDAIVVLAETHKDPAPVPATAEDAAREQVSQ
ncbi:MAG TPA: HD domain-containing phosphohydrolase [Actinomycetota bacterium]|nr:HD domain-containing phosphohydrolase [Actinomycetota bacterium]